MSQQLTIFRPEQSKRAIRQTVTEIIEQSISIIDNQMETDNREDGNNSPRAFTTPQKNFIQSLLSSSLEEEREKIKKVVDEKFITRLNEELEAERSKMKQQVDLVFKEELDKEVKKQLAEETVRLRRELEAEKEKMKQQVDTVFKTEVNREVERKLTEQAVEHDTELNAVAQQVEERVKEKENMHRRTIMEQEENFQERLDRALRDQAAVFKREIEALQATKFSVERMQEVKNRV